MIACHADLLDAYDAGRTHTQRFIKTGAGMSGDGKWQDWAFQAGQPAYDARIGPAGAFMPAVAVKNDALYFPPVPAGAQRMLHKLCITPKASNASVSLDFVLYDLVGYYPLIDGDSADPQEMDNTLTLPRYTDGAGLHLVMFNHVSPAAQTGIMQLDITDQTGAAKSVTLGVPLLGQNFVCSPSRNLLTNDIGALTVATGTAGIRSVNRVTYTTPPGGLHCLYIIKPLATLVHYHDALLQADTSGMRHAVELDFALKDGWRMPIIQDGAHLAFFYRSNGGGRTITFFGDATFIWN